LREQVAGEQSDGIAAAVVAMGERIARGGRLLIFGNGGSATDATDFALDCVLDAPGMRAVPAISLAAEPAVLSAIANDVGAELTFQRQLIAQSRPHDVAFAMSTSGGSKNVVAALEEARKRGLLTVALLGYDGGEIVRRGLADHAIVVRSDYIPRIQEAQAAIYHVMRRALAELSA
jgi:D-sedoheptulose 7-phosphate isomerase